MTANGSDSNQRIFVILCSAALGLLVIASLILFEHRHDDLTAIAKMVYHDRISLLLWPFIFGMTGHFFYSVKHREGTISWLEQQTEHILESMSNMLAIIDPEGRVKLVNRTLTETLGFSPAEMHGKFLTKFIPEDPRGFDKENCVKKLNAGECHGCEFSLQGKGARSVPVRANCTIMKDRTGRTLATAIFMDDLSALKKSEQIISEQHHQIMAAAKMSALGEMAGGVAHEINNPLAIIYGNAEQIKELLDQEPFDKALAAKNVEKIVEISMRIAKIIKGLRSFCRDETENPFYPASVKAIIGDTLELCREKFKHNGISLTFDPPSDDLMIECRPTQIAQVVLNLLNNAFDAVEKLADRWVTISTKTYGEMVEMIVVDSGGGLPPELRERIFQPFYTTKDIGKGTGLGLSISKGIVESHNGMISVDPFCKNTCFVVRLPRKQESLSVPQTNEAAHEAAKEAV